jgi:hypothetical protein
LLGKTQAWILDILRLSSRGPLERP